MVPLRTIAGRGLHKSADFVHGRYTKAAIEERCEVRAPIRVVRAWLAE